MTNYQIYPVGRVRSSEEGTWIEIDEKYIPALEGLEGFSHINVLWWCNEFDDEQSRSVLQAEQPYKGAPGVMGIFATRSPLRPNPVALTTAEIISADYEKGVIQIAFIDAFDNTPVLDIKPYTPSFDRIENPGVPAWCSNWPKSSEESADFAWDEVFNF